MHNSWRVTEYLLSAGKLGHGDDENHKVPKAVKTLQDAKEVVVMAEGGCEHSACITASGKLYTWGHGDSGRLGHNNEKSCTSPKRVDIADGLAVVNLWCDSRCACISRVLNKARYQDS